MYVIGLQIKKGGKKDGKSELKTTRRTENTIDCLETMSSHMHIQPRSAFSLHEILSPETFRFSQKSYFETTAALSLILNGCWL